MREESQSERFRRELDRKAGKGNAAPRNLRNQGIGPNKAAGRKGGIRRQGSKRG